MNTIKFLEEIKTKVTKQTLNIDYGTKEFSALANLNANIEMHLNCLKGKKG